MHVIGVKEFENPTMMENVMFMANVQRIYLYASHFTLNCDSLKMLGLVLTKDTPIQNVLDSIKLSETAENV